MKITDFGLWFQSRNNNKIKWTNSIPDSMQFDICYDAQLIARVHNNSKTPYLTMFQFNDLTHIVKLNMTYETTESGFDIINQPLTINDFQIIPNPYYNPK